MIAGAEQPEDRVDSRHPGRKHIGAVAAFQLGHRAFQCFTIWVIRPRVIVAFVLPQFFVDIGGGLIDGRDDGSRGGVGLLPDMDGVGGKTHCALLAMLALIVKQSGGVNRRCSALAVGVTLIVDAFPIVPAEQCLENLQELYW